MNWSTVIRECARTDDVCAFIGAALFFAGLAGMAVMG